VKLGIKEKRQEKGEEEGCMERKVHVGNKWWKIMTVYSKEVKTTRRRVQDAMKKNRDAHVRGLQPKNRRKRSKKSGRVEGGWKKKIQKQGGKCRGEETDGMDRSKKMGSVEREQTRERRRGMDLYM
jgi:hypothetical protein